MTAASPAPSLRDFCFYVAARGLANFSFAMLQVAIGYQIYDMTSDALALGYIGLAIFLPGVALILVGGDTADRYDRRVVLGLGYGTICLASGGLWALTAAGVTHLAPYYAVLALIGAAQSFTRPTDTSFVPFLIARENLARGLAWTSSANQVTNSLGPFIAGLILLIGPAAVYQVNVVFYAVAVGLYAALRVSGRAAGAAAPSGSAIGRLRDGLIYMRRQPVILGAISLDLFAVLLGGSLVLLPVFARDVLHVGPEGLGAMRMSQAVGAVVMGLILTTLPIGRRAGRAMFLSIAVFGLATVVFALSTSFALSLAALFMLGASNMVGWNFRHTVIQMATPDAMRGRVSAASSLCTGAADRLGDFEAGVAASLLGAVNGTALGGVGTLAVAAIWTWLFPELRRVDRMTDVKPAVD